MVFPLTHPLVIVLPPRFAGLGTPSALGALGAAQPFLSVNLSSPPGWDSMLKATTTRVITVMDRQVRMAAWGRPMREGRGWPMHVLCDRAQSGSSVAGSPMRCGGIPVNGSINCEAGQHPLIVWHRAPAAADSAHGALHLASHAPDDLTGKYICLSPSCSSM